MQRGFIEILRCPGHREAGLTLHPSSLVEDDEIEEGSADGDADS